MTTTSIAQNSPNALTCSGGTVNLVTAGGNASAFACGIGNNVRPEFGTDGNGNSAFGIENQISGAGETTAVGYANSTGGIRNTVVGSRNQTYGDNRNTLVGYRNNSFASEGIAIGTNNSILPGGSDYATMVGHDSYVLGARAIAIGTGVTVGTGSDLQGVPVDDGIAIGSNATVRVLDGAVAIGANSVAREVHTGPTSINGGSIAGEGASGSVFSIGSLGGERQLQNVAAGVVSETSTDAVNGSQLYAVGTQVNQNTADIAQLRSEAFQGTAMAIAMSGAVLIPGKTSSLTMNFGNYRGETAFAASLNHLVNPNTVISGALGIAGSSKDIGARVGVTFGW